MSETSTQTRPTRLLQSPEAKFAVGAVAMLCASLFLTVLIFLKVEPRESRKHTEIPQKIAPIRQRTNYPKKSPFEAVRWRGPQPQVQVEGEWFKLVQIEAVQASEIVDFCQRTYGEKWQKRFEEDLVEVLTLMKHTPKGSVDLVVESLTSPETRVLNDVVMSEENRRAIRNAAQAREKSEG